MSATTGALMTILGGHDPVAIVFYRDDESREDLIQLCELLAPKASAPCKTSSIEDAFGDAYRNTLLLVVPESTDKEIDAVRILDGRREALLDRNVPAILFLMQDGSAEDILKREAHALWSFLGGLTYDPEPPPNPFEVQERRTIFEEKHGRTAEDWLASWRRDEIEDTAENNLIAHEAWVLRQ